ERGVAARDVEVRCGRVVSAKRGTRVERETKVRPDRETGERDRTVLQEAERLRVRMIAHDRIADARAQIAPDPPRERDRCAVSHPREAGGLRGMEDTDQSLVPGGEDPAIDRPRSGRPEMMRALVALEAERKLPVRILDRQIEAARTEGDADR